MKNTDFYVSDSESLQDRVKSEIVSCVIDQHGALTKKMKEFDSERKKAKRSIRAGKGKIHVSVDRKTLDKFSRAIRDTKKELDKMESLIDCCRGFAEDKYTEATGNDFSEVVHWYSHARQRVRLSAQAWMKVYVLCNKTLPFSTSKFL